MNRSRTHAHFDEYLWPLAGVSISFNWSALEATTMGRPAGIDEYLWPLDGLAVNFDWDALKERTDAQRRLAAIYEHVVTTHAPAGPRPATRAPSGSQSPVIEGAADAPLWERRLKAPVPKALREEWESLCEVMRGRPRETYKKRRARSH